MTIDGKMAFFVALAASATLSFAQPAAMFARELTSPALAKELGSLMKSAQLEAIAVQDPDAPERFVAALLFPDVQLLMAWARYPSPEYLKTQIDRKAYKEVYGLLQQADLAESRVFFQDLGADGLHERGTESIDVMYERGKQTLFDGGNNGGSRDTYEKKLREADAVYSRLLQLAISALRSDSPVPLAPVARL